MNPFLRTQYFTDLYAHIIANDYNALEYSSLNSSYHNSFVKLIPKNTEIEKNQFYRINLISSVKTFVDLCSNSNPAIYDKNGNKDMFLKKFFISYFHQNRDKQKDLLKFCNDLGAFSLNKDYIELFPKIFQDKNELISALKNLPSKRFNMHQIDEIKIFHEFLKSFKLTNNEIKNTFFIYYNERKSFLKNVAYSTNAKNFLLYLYNDDNKGIDKYFSFMPFLKNEFLKTDNDKDIFKKDSTFEIISKINLDRIFKNFSIDFYTIEKYESFSSEFVKSYAKSLNTKKFDVYRTTDKTSLRVVISHEKPNETTDEFENTFINFLHFLKNNPTFQIESDKIDKWLMHTKISDKIKMKKSSTPMRKI